MLNGVLSMFESCFSFFYTTLCNIPLSENTNAWNFFLAIFISSSVIAIVLRTLGGTGIMSSSGSTKSAIEKQKRKK